VLESCKMVVGLYFAFSSGFSYVCVGFDFEGDRHFFRKTIKLYNFPAVATQNSSKEKLDDIVF